MGKIEFKFKTDNARTFSNPIIPDPFLVFIFTNLTTNKRFIPLNSMNYKKKFILGIEKIHYFHIIEDMMMYRFKYILS